ncbi:MAG: HD domain-containing protein [Candidatus Bathyarchaeota archaeon]|nr:HD domain-containing protein [Candidatus Bathyarchaeota archaeon]
MARKKDRRRRLLEDLSKSSVVQRLKHIDLSAVPRWLGPQVSTASRYQHSLGVGNLSLLVSGGTEHERLLLTAAAALHDVGDGPFPHLSDQVMKEMLGFSHEGAVRFAFENSSIKDSSILSRYGLDVTEVSSVLEYRHRLSPFLYGFPDLDNADNIHRFMTTVPGKPLGEPSYIPSEIAASMSLDPEEREIPTDIQRRWAADYGRVYSYVWNGRLNMVCWTMLGRALRILKEELTPRFFRRTNREAFHLIRLRLPELADGLKTKEFKILLDKKYVQLRGEAQRLLEQSNLGKIEEELCRETGLEGWALGLTVDQPLIKEKPDHWRVYLVSHRGNEEPKALLEDMLLKSEPFPSTLQGNV